jgi:hypothetical protein
VQKTSLTIFLCWRKYFFTWYDEMDEGAVDVSKEGMPEKNVKCKIWRKKKI